SRVAGQELFNAVVKKLKLLEIDYFRLGCWLDHEKTLPKQCPATIELIFYFSGQSSIHQIRTCLEETNTPAEIGDFLEEEYLDTLYLTQLKVLRAAVHGGSAEEGHGVSQGAH
uniref:FERM_N domain-containing protein n=1 Tax=Macrostomum lignano TaxID=282301 RepID=A0A1I8FE21_9PLAT